MAELIKNKQVDWIFFDLGDVIVNEDKLRFNLYRLLEKTLRENSIFLGFQEIIAAREDLILGHADESPHYTIAKMYLSPDAYHRWKEEIKTYVHKHMLRDLILVPGIDRIIKKLHHTYSMGIIADQPHEIMRFLYKYDLAKYFKVFAISGLVHINKPHKKIFEWALNHAGCSFGKAVMIGDRIDRDIAPARQMDMRTVQVKWPTYRKGFSPVLKKQKLYLESLHRIKNWAVEPCGNAESPDAIVEKISELLPAIQKLS